MHFSLTFISIMIRIRPLACVLMALIMRIGQWFARCRCYHSWNIIWQWSRTPTRNHWVMLGNNAAVTITCCCVLQDHCACYCRCSVSSNLWSITLITAAWSADSRSSLIADCTIWQNWSVEPNFCRFADLLQICFITPWRCNKVCGLPNLPSAATVSWYQCITMSVINSLDRFVSNRSYFCSDRKLRMIMIICQVWWVQPEMNDRFSL